MWCDEWRGDQPGCKNSLARLATTLFGDKN